MSKYKIRGDKNELPDGSLVYVIPVAEVQPGQLAMFALEGDPKALVVGRWYPNVEGFNYISQPKRLIRDAGTVPVRILGVVIPVENPPKEIATLNVLEYVTALLYAREVKG
jgi:hypothetical protein